MPRSVSRKDFTVVSALMNRSPDKPRPGPGVDEVPDGDCWVCEKYEIRGKRIVAGFGKDDLANWRIIYPLDEAPDLFLRFSRLHRDRDFAQAALSFSHQYGLPCGMARTGSNASFQPEELTLQRFFAESQRAWIVVSLYESVLNRDEDAASGLLTDYRHVDDAFQKSFDMLNKGIPGSRALVTPLHCALSACVRAVDPIISNSCSQHLFIHIDGTSQATPSALKQVWRIDDLLSAMYLQMYWILTSGGNLTRCEHCRRVISLARSHPEGRKRRRDKKFCDDACRQAHHRSKKQTQEARA